MKTLILSGIFLLRELNLQKQGKPFLVMLSLQMIKTPGDGSQKTNIYGFILS